MKAKGLFKRCRCADKEKCRHSWYISYFHEGRRKRRAIGPNKGLASTVLGKFKGQIAEGKYLDIPKDKQITFAEFSEIYLDKYAKPLKASWKSDDLKVITAALPVLGQKKLMQIVSQDIQLHIIERRKSIKAASANKDLTILKSMFNRAVEWGYLHKNPAQIVKRFKISDEDERTRVVSIEELDALLCVSDPELQAIIMLAVMTLLRKNDICALEDKKFNFQNLTINTIQQKVKKKICLPINDTLLSLLKNKDISLPIRYNFHKRFQTALKRARAAERKRCEDAGLPFSESFLADVMFRDLRRTGATYMQDHLDVDPYIVSMLLGHNAPKAFLMSSKYMIVSEEKKYAAVKKLDAYCGLSSGRNWTHDSKLAHLPKLEPNQIPQTIIQ